MHLTYLASDSSFKPRASYLSLLKSRITDLSHRPGCRQLQVPIEHYYMYVPLYIWAWLSKSRAQIWTYLRAIAWIHVKCLIDWVLTQILVAGTEVSQMWMGRSWREHTRSEGTENITADSTCMALHAWFDGSVSFRDLWSLYLTRKKDSKVV